MIPVAAIVLALAIVLLPPWLRSRRRAREAARTKALLWAVETNTLLRQQILTRAVLVGLPPGTPGTPRFVVMDWGTGEGVVTLVAAADGAVSVYFVTGGGIIGAGSQDKVAKAAVPFREEAKRLLVHFSPVKRFYVPARRRAVIFYVVTDAATLSSGERDASVTQPPSDPFAELQRLAHELLAEVRLASDAGPGPAHWPPIGTLPSLHADSRPTPALHRVTERRPLQDNRDPLGDSPWGRGACYGWPATFTGTALGVGEPSPSWPLAFWPQQ